MIGGRRVRIKNDALTWAPSIPKLVAVSSALIEERLDGG
jgi:hypothetical protein